jgi:hypothetical protein
MASKLSYRFLLCTTLTAAAAGCSQIVGISDYEIDPKLDGPAGGEGGRGSGTAGTAGTLNAGGLSGGQPANDGGAPDPGGAGSPMSGEAGAGGAAPGVIVPCDSADCCAALGGTARGVELLKDGGFELGGPDAESPWGEVTTTAGNPLIIDDLSFGFEPKVGDWFVYLSGLPGEESIIYQTPVVPKDAGWLVVSGWRLFQVDTQDDMNKDFATIGIYEYPSGDRVEIAAYWSAPPAQDGWGDAPKWTRFEYSFDALPHQGLKREIDFWGSSDEYSTDTESKASSYLFDELSFKSFSCYK